MKSTMVAAAMACVLLSACQGASIRSTPDGREDGVAYYLPMRLLKLHYTRTEPVTDARKRLARAQAAFDAAKEALAKAKQASEDAEALRAAGAGDHAASQRLAEEAAYQKALLALATRTHEAATTELASATAALVAEQAAQARAGDCKLVEQVVVTPTALLPDTSQRFVAQVQHSPWRRDQVKLETTRQGLLTSSSATLSDETSAILLALFRSRAATSGSGHKLLWESTLPGGELACRPESIEMTLPPDDLAPFNEAIAAAGSRLVVSWREPNLGVGRVSGVSRCVPRPHAQRETAGDCGLLYRRELTHLLELREMPAGNEFGLAGGAGSDARLVTTVPVALPNFSPIERINFNATTFATNTSKLAFDNGLLTSADTDQPSEMLGVARLPVDIVSGVLESVTGLVQLRINLGQQDVDRADQERALVCALDRLRAAQDGTEPSLPASACP